ncbi:hypothetical protein HMPREF0880_02594 [Yokenella regensburgei ATCC 43003]|nr:hypothetical protein HMPREF0880_02594 [Yokenella regensburgei ATCC 43003]
MHPKKHSTDVLTVSGEVLLFFRSNQFLIREIEDLLLPENKEIKND